MLIDQEHCKQAVGKLIEDLNQDKFDRLKSLKLKADVPEKQTEAANILLLLDWLKAQKAFNLGHQLLHFARKAHRSGQFEATLEELKKFRQQQALCTYKDNEIVTEEGLQAALNILNSDQNDLLEETCDQETLGIAGAIYKRMWEVDPRIHHLELAYQYYHRGYLIFKTGQNSGDDNGYTGINAAFILDLIGSQIGPLWHKLNEPCDDQLSLQQQADEIRSNIVTILSHRVEPILQNMQDLKKNMAANLWLVQTLIEAYFGLERYDEAKPLVEAIKKADVQQSWQRETFIRQLAILVRLRKKVTPKDKNFYEDSGVQLIGELINPSVDSIEGLFIGKVGLALSGGGFRASLFHLGVLAKLAEYDVLRHIEVISCVSGGSVVGAHYYLALKKRLEASTGRLTRQCYIELVDEVITTFVAGVQQDIRTKAMLQFWRRTERAAELFEEYFYAKIDPLPNHEPHMTCDLKINPEGQENFNPTLDNWNRYAKVPILILNATTFNTGHNWQFTASWMGEPKAYIEDDIDALARLRRMWYQEAPLPYKNKGISLGRAVAASACVPVIFKPIKLKGLYPNKVVQLIDGGVRENQGIFGLFEQSCDVLLVSDGCGQLDDQKSPSKSWVNAFKRASDITMQAVRSAYYKQIMDRNHNGKLRASMYVHLKKELEAVPIDWVGSGKQCSTDSIADVGITSYGIPKNIQKYLAEARTDLDSFDDVEMYALMLSGYRMTEKSLPNSIDSLPIDVCSSSHQWQFLQLEQSLESGGDDAEAVVKELAYSQYSHLRAQIKWWDKAKERIKSWANNNIHFVKS